MEKMTHMVLFLSVAVLIRVTFHAPAVDAQTAGTPFYQGKTITVIVGSGPGGTGDLRTKTMTTFLAKNIAGNPTIAFQYMPGGGGRKATNHAVNTAAPDGLTMMRVPSSIVPYAVLGETGIQYDIDKLIYLGTTEHVLYYLFYTRKTAGLSSLEKLRAAAGVRIGSQPVGHTGYILSRMMAYFLGMNDPKFVPGYDSPEIDIALMQNEVDARIGSTGTVMRNPDFVNKGLVDFHATIEFPKGHKDARFVPLNLPTIDSFAKSEKEQKLLAMMRGFRSIGSIYALPPGTPKNQMQILKEAARKTYADPEFRKEYRRVTGGDEPSPLMPEEQEKMIKEIPRDPETVQLYKQFAGTGPLPRR